MIVVDGLSKDDWVLRSAITRLEAEMERMKKVHDMELSAHRDGCNEEIERLKVGVESGKERMREHRDALERVNAQLRVVESELRNCELISAGREEDIVRLKARLYDETVKASERG
jgi:chromosome segregation ATPase